MSDEDDLPTMPFVLTKAHGGEYDNEAYAAGWYLGVLDARLTLAEMAGLIVPPLVLREKWKKQVDLIAMARGMVLKVTPLEEQPGYAVFTLAPGEFFHADGEL